MKPDQDRVRMLLTDTITLLCKNGLHFQKEMRIQGLLGITLDNDDVFLVHINESLNDRISNDGNPCQPVMDTHKKIADGRDLPRLSKQGQFLKRRRLNNVSEVGSDFLCANTIRSSSGASGKDTTLNSGTQCCFKSTNTDGSTSSKIVVDKSNEDADIECIDSKDFPLFTTSGGWEESNSDDAHVQSEAKFHPANDQDVVEHDRLDSEMKEVSLAGNNGSSIQLSGVRHLKPKRYKSSTPNIHQWPSIVDAESSTFLADDLNIRRENFENNLVSLFDGKFGNEEV